MHTHTCGSAPAHRRFRFSCVRFSVEQAIAAPRHAVEAAFLDPGFYAALGELSAIRPPEVLERRVEAERHGPGRRPALNLNEVDPGGDVRVDPDALVGRRMPVALRQRAGQEMDALIEELRKKMPALPVPPRMVSTRIWRCSIPVNAACGSMRRSPPPL